MVSQKSFSFWGTSPLDPAGGLPSPRPPVFFYVPSPNNHVRSTPLKASLTFGLERVSRNVFLCDAEENGVSVELVELCLEECDWEGARKRRHALTQRRTMSAVDIHILLFF